MPESTTTVADATTTTTTQAPATTTGASDSTAAASAAAVATEVAYTLQLPDGSALPADAIERTTAIARELGLSNDAAQRMLTSMNAEATTVAESRANAAREEVIAAYQPGGAEWTKVADGWKKATMEDTALGKTPEERKAAIQRGVSVVNRFGEAHPKLASDLKSFMDTTGFGNHPTMVRFFAWLGKSAGEPQEMVRGSQAEEKDQRNVWFPNTKFPGQSDAA